MTELYDIVYRDQKVSAPLIRWHAAFFHDDVQSLDAPECLPAGSTIAYSDFHATRVTDRG